MRAAATLSRPAAPSPAGRRGPGNPRNVRAARRAAQQRRRRRLLAWCAAGLASALTVAGVAIFAQQPNGSSGSVQPIAHTGTNSPGSASAAAPAPTTTPPTTPPTAPAATFPPSATTTLHLSKTITGQISPKSVDASGTGIVFAQNMMYQHTMTVYDKDGNLLKTIPDSVDLTSFGVPNHPGISRGAPVEAVFSPDRKYVYASNYSMYGAGFGREGTDTCSPASGYGPSFAYRIDTTTLAIDKVIQVGSVPKYVAITPNNRYLLVTNWCSYDLSIVDTATNTEVKRLPLGPYPRGIVVDPTSTIAYIAVMGTRNIAKVNLATLSVDWIQGVGNGPRHVVMDPAGKFLYVTLNADGQVAKIDLTTDQVVGRVATGSEPRSMAISKDGQALYVVNYNSNTISKVATADMHVLQVIPTPSHPIGITYDSATARVWVAAYSGAILVFNDA